jgi:hypothetical protein
MSWLKILGIAAGVLAAAGAARLTMSNPGNVAETSVDNKDAALRPRRYKTTLDNFRLETEKIIPTLSTYGKNWKNGGGGGGSGKSSDMDWESGSASMLVEVPVFVFTDDLNITAEADGETEGITVNVRSASRFGNSDLGENRRHILQLLEVLDEKFGENNVKP